VTQSFGLMMLVPSEVIFVTHELGWPTHVLVTQAVVFASCDFLGNRSASYLTHFLNIRVLQSIPIILRLCGAASYFLLVVYRIPFFYFLYKICTVSRFSDYRDS